MVRRVVEKLCAKRVCINFLAPKDDAIRKSEVPSYFYGRRDFSDVNMKHAMSNHATRSRRGLY